MYVGNKSMYVGLFHCKRRNGKVQQLGSEIPLSLQLRDATDMMIILNLNLKNNPDRVLQVDTHGPTPPQHSPRLAISFAERPHVQGCLPGTPSVRGTAGLLVSCF